MMGPEAVRAGSLRACLSVRVCACTNTHSMQRFVARGRRPAVARAGGQLVANVNDVAVHTVG